MGERIIPLIMCGGAGTRLWPASREVRPKQFLPLFGPRSTFQDTLLRVSDAALFERPVRDHQHRLSLHGAGATGRDRPRGRRAAGADAAGFRPGDCGRRGLCRDARSRGDRAGARRRPRGARCRSFRRRLPPGAGRGRRGTYRHLRRQARTCRDRIWLYQPRRGYLRRGPRRGEVRREAGSGDGRGIYQGRLSLEQRQLHVPRLRAARRISQCRRAERAGGHRCGDQSGPRSRIRHAGGRTRSDRPRPSPSIMR